MLKQFRLRKSNQNVPKMAAFRKYKGLNIKHSHRDPPRGIFLPGTTSFGVFCEKNPFTGAGCRLIEEPPQTNKKLVTPKARLNQVLGEQKLLNRLLRNFTRRVPSRT